MRRMKITRKRLIGQLESKREELRKNLVEFSRVTPNSSEHAAAIAENKMFLGGQYNMLVSALNVLTGITKEIR